MLRSVGFYIAIGLGLLLAVWTANPVRVQPTSAPPAAFSAGRAMQDVVLIARAPHPTGSAENTRVRDALTARLQSLGFAVDVYRAPALLPERTLIGAWPETLVAVRPGADRTLPPVAIMSHYDSVAGSPGAADDAAGVAASLEVARALAADGPGARDLVLIVTDGEEPGLLGARAFFAGHPLAKRLGAVVNLEARGSSGPALMFETSADNGGLIGRYAESASLPVSNSLLGWVYDHMPNGTDFTLAKEAGVAGLNFAFLGRPFDYHSATSTPANLDQRSLQSMGDQTLAVVRDLASAQALPARAPSLAYSDVLGLTLVAYPVWAGWLLLAAAAGLIAVAWLRLGQWKPAPLEIARGAGGLLLVLLGVALAIRFLGGFVPAGETFYQGRAGSEFGLYLAAVGLLTGGFTLAFLTNLSRGQGRWRTVIVLVALAIGCCLLRGLDVVALGMAAVSAGLAALLLGRATAPKGLWAGALLLILVLGVVLQALAPQTAFLLAWPLLLGAALAAFTALGTRPGALSTVLAVAGGALAVAWLARLAGHTFDGLGLEQPEAVAIFSTLSLLIIAPLALDAAQALSGRIAAGVAAAAAVVLTLFIALHDPATARTPQPSHLFHVTDLSDGRTTRVTALENPGGWTLAALGPEARPQDVPALFMRGALSAPTTPAAPAPPPTITAAREGDRTVLTITAPGAREVRLGLKGLPLNDLTVAGLAAKATPDRDGWVRLRWYAPRGGFTVAFGAPAGGELAYRLASIRDGWPARAAPLPARPADVMPWQGADSAVLAGEGVVRW